MDLVIGAGISGLSYVNFCIHDKYLVIEKESKIGGYLKTIKKNGFTWDYSGHFFHFKNPEIRKHIIKRMNGQKILNLQKKSQIKYKRKHIDHP